MADDTVVTRPIEKIYILRINHELSNSRSLDCAKSCEEIGMPYEFFQGTQGVPQDKLHLELDFPVEIKHRFSVNHMNASVSHLRIWKHIFDRKETAIILEHDAMMLWKPTLPIPDGAIVACGYKLMNYLDYDSKAAGPPTSIAKIFRHFGAHAYALTWKTAGELIDELMKYGLRSCIDTGYFMRIGSTHPWGKKEPPPDKQTGIPLMLSDPILAIGWVRDSRSTVAHNSGAPNAGLTPSFKNHLK